VRALGTPATRVAWGAHSRHGPAPRHRQRYATSWRLSGGCFAHSTPHSAALSRLRARFVLVWCPRTPQKRYLALCRRPMCSPPQHRHQGGAFPHLPYHPRPPHGGSFSHGGSLVGASDQAASMSNGFIILVTIGKKGRFWCLSGIGGLSGRESRWASVVAAALYERIGPSEYRRPLKQSEKRPGGGSGGASTGHVARRMR
jgi:hypothetical protein